MMHSFSRVITNQDRILSKGAEATIYEGSFLGNPVIIKKRESKKYRIPDIDYKLRKERSIQEVRILYLAKMQGLPVPRILDFDKSNWIIIMEKLQGIAIKTKFDVLDHKDVFHMIGQYIAKLHSLDIIHGDLTTSNILIDSEGNISIIDFGLGFISTNIEDRAVDILVLKHTLESSHSDFSDICYTAFIEGYTTTLDDHVEIINRLETVENRVRYRKHEI